MSGKKLVLLLTAALFAATLWGCGSNRDSGGSDVTSADDQPTVAALGSDNCKVCHTEIYNQWLNSGTGHSNPNVRPSSAGESCAACHDPNSESVAFGHPVVSCEACHGGGSAHRGVGPIPVPEPSIEQTCANCHSNPDGHPGDVVSLVMNSNHAELGHNDEAKCQRCHTTEGAIEFADVTGDKDVMAALDEVAPVNPEETTAPACFACHDEHTAELRVPASWNPLALDGATPSEQFELCTSCHVYTDEAGTLVASGVEGTGTEPFYHNTAWYRTIASTHYDDPTTGVHTVDPNDRNNADVGLNAEKTIEGYVLRTQGENPCFDCHSHDLTANTRPGRDATILTDWSQSAHAGGLLKAKYAKHDELDVENTWGELDHRGNPAMVNRTAEGTAQIMEVGATDSPIGNAWAHYNWDRAGRSSCQHCHTATGAANFLDAADEGEAYDASTNDFSHLADWTEANKAYGSPQNEMLYCWGCHSNVERGRLRATGAIPLDYTVGGAEVSLTAPDENSGACLSCHTGRGNMDTLLDGATANPAGTAVTGGTSTHYLTAGGTIFHSDTKTGYEYAGQEYADVSYYAHNGLGCAECHMTSENSHSFDVVEKDDTGAIVAITSTKCVDCHDGEHALFVGESQIGEEANIWNGTAAVPTTVTETMVEEAAAELEHEAHGYHNALEALAAALTTAGTTPTSNYPYFSGAATDQGHGGAMHNYSYLHHEPGAYAHNRYYAKRLIFDSLDWLTSGAAGARALDGSITLDPATYEAAIQWLGGDVETGVIANRP